MGCWASSLESCRQLPGLPRVFYTDHLSFVAALPYAEERSESFPPAQSCMDAATFPLPDGCAALAAQTLPRLALASSTGFVRVRCQSKWHRAVVSQWSIETLKSSYWWRVRWMSSPTAWNVYWWCCHGGEVIASSCCKIASYCRSCRLRLALAMIHDTDYDSLHHDAPTSHTWEEGWRAYDGAPGWGCRSAIRVSICTL